MSDGDQAQWRAMSTQDLPAVVSIAGRTHLAYPEDDDIFAERLRLYPPGCRVFASDRGVLGYVLSHPWVTLKPPSLNVALGALPDMPSTYYIHDTVVLPEARGAGAATQVVRDLIRHAASTGVDNMSLIAVKGTPEFWSRHGFGVVDDPVLAQKLASYDSAARYMVRTLP